MESDIFLDGEYKTRKVLVNESNYYKDIKISTAGSDFLATKLPSELSAMSITSIHIFFKLLQ